MSKIFLKAEWRHLAMLNFAVDPAILEPYVPQGTQLDLWQGKHALVSIVGFMFYKTRMFGAPVPFHADFEELNLRFYVVRDLPAGPRRGVCFIKEIVKRPAISFVARTLYNENYVTLPMRHAIEESNASMRVEYQWRLNKRWNSLSCVGAGTPVLPARGSEADFIIEHYWGYSVQRNGGCKEYEVAHPPWRVWENCDYTLDVDFEALYGSLFAKWLLEAPTSALIAEGSAITVSTGMRLPNS